MTTILPDSEQIRKAVKWVSAERQADANKSTNKLIEAAALQFNLSPMEVEYLVKLVSNKTE